MPQICRPMTVFLIFSKQSESILIWIFKSISKLLSKFENVTNMTKFVIHWPKNQFLFGCKIGLTIHTSCGKYMGKYIKANLLQFEFCWFPHSIQSFQTIFFHKTYAYMIGNFANILVNFTSKTGSIPRKSQKISKKNNRVSHSQATDHR